VIIFFRVFYNDLLAYWDMVPYKRVLIADRLKWISKLTSAIWQLTDEMTDSMLLLAGDVPSTRAAMTACVDDNQPRANWQTAAVIDVRPLPGRPWITSGQCWRTLCRNAAFNWRMRACPSKNSTTLFHWSSGCTLCSSEAPNNAHSANFFTRDSRMLRES